MRPPQVRERKVDILSNQATSRKTVESGTRRSPASGSMLYDSSDVSVARDARDSYQDEKQDYSRDVRSNPLVFVFF